MYIYETKSYSNAIYCKRPLQLFYCIVSTGIYYRLFEDQVLNEILYSDITRMNIKKEYPSHFKLLFFTGSFIISTGILFNNVNGFFNVIHAIVWVVFLYVIKIKDSYTIQIHRGPLVTEVFLTNNKIEAERVIAEIESNIS